MIEIIILSILAACGDRVIGCWDVGSGVRQDIQALAPIHIVAASMGAAGKLMHDQDVAAQKVKAVYDHIQSRLPEGSFWECGTDLENGIELYLPNADQYGNYGDIYVPLSDITLLDGKLDFDSRQRIDAILRERSL